MAKGDENPKEERKRTTSEGAEKEEAEAEGYMICQGSDDDDLEDLEVQR